MLPTFDLTNEIVLLDRISTRHGNVGPNDVVILQSPENPKRLSQKDISEWKMTVSPI
ncbi:hypothetical protein Hanom_Chr03g00262701 [Helianthus anomalus]